MSASGERWSKRIGPEGLEAPLKAGVEVRCYLESARHKLGAANNTHAVNKAGKASLLSQLP